MMKLYSASASPFARKVMVAAHELGLAGRIAVENVTTSPVAQNAALAAVNPLARLPTLLLEDGSALYDSRVILDYLDSLTGGGILIPKAGPERFAALRRQALAEGLLDTLVSLRYETALRPEAVRWPELVAAQFDRMGRALAAAESEAASLSVEKLGIAEIGFACLFGYLDLRFGDYDWRSRAPSLARWYQAVAERPSLMATTPR